MKSAWVFEAIYIKWPKIQDRQECSKTIGKTCISASAKNPGALEILRLGGNPYKTLGKRWFHATETGT